MGNQLQLHSELYEKLFNVLQNRPNTLEIIQGALADLETEYGESVYSHLIYILCHLFFDTKDSKKHWEHIIQYRDKMILQLGNEVDFRVALLSYFLDIKQEIKSPTILEIKVFQQTQIEAIVDQLTGLYNYRYFMKQLSEEVKKAKRYNSYLSLLILDLDEFKLFNDYHGHMKGNAILFEIAKNLLSCVREVDIVARYGGEEFTILFPNTPKDGAYIVAERIRKSIEEKNIIIKSTNIEKKLTISGGIATYPIDAATEQELLERSDRALYIAKSKNKNNITLFSNEKRAHTRFNVTVKGSFSMMSAEQKPFQTVNISVGGILLKTIENIELNSIMKITLTVILGNDSNRNISFYGKAIRINKVVNYYEVGIKIMDINYKDEVDLINYLKFLEANDD